METTDYTPDYIDTTEPHQYRHQLIVSAGCFFFLNLLFDLSLNSLFAFVLPDFISKFRRNAQDSDEEFGLFNAKLKGNRTKQHTILANAIISGNVVGEWRTNLISLMQMLTTGLYSSSFMYLNQSILDDPIGYELNGALVNLHSLKTGFLLYRLLVTIIRFQGDNSTGLIMSNLVYLVLVIETMNANQYFLFTTFGYLIDCQSTFHYFKRAFIFIEITDSFSYQLCNCFNLLLIITLRPYVHFHQFNWLYTVYYANTNNYLWFIATLNASLHCLDTLFLLFDYFKQLIGMFQEFQMQTNLPMFESFEDDRPIFTKLRRFDSDNEIIYF